MRYFGNNLQPVSKRKISTASLIFWILVFGSITGVLAAQKPSKELR